MHKFFYVLWKKREDKYGNIQCFECNRSLKREDNIFNSSVYSHILSKSEYPKYALKEWNLVICCSDCHFLYTNNKEMAKKQYALYLELLEKHKNNEL